MDLELSETAGLKAPSITIGILFADLDIHRSVGVASRSSLLFIPVVIAMKPPKLSVVWKQIVLAPIWLGLKIRKLSSEVRILSTLMTRSAKAVPTTPKEIPTVVIKTTPSFLTILIRQYLVC